MRSFLIETIIFLSFSIPALVIDVKTLRIPDLLVFPCLTALLLFSFLTRQGFYSGVVATILAGSFLLFIRLFTKGLGLGDVKYGLCIGAYCGIAGTFPAFLLASFAGIIIAGSVSLIGKKKFLHRPVPFAPFLASGALAAKIILLFFTPNGSLFWIF